MSAPSSASPGGSILPWRAAPCLPVSSEQPLGTIRQPPAPPITSPLPWGANSSINNCHFSSWRYLPNTQRQFCSTPQFLPIPPHDGAGWLLILSPRLGTEEGLGQCPSLWGRDGAKTTPRGGQGEHLPIIAKLKAPQAEEPNSQWVRMGVMITVDVLVTAVNKNNCSNKIAMMLVIALELMRKIRLFINYEPLSAFSSASASQIIPNSSPIILMQNETNEERSSWHNQGLYWEQPSLSLCSLSSHHVAGVEN